MGTTQSAQQLLSCISAALVQIYGAVAGALSFEALSFQASTGVGIIKCLRK